MDRRYRLEVGLTLAGSLVMLVGAYVPSIRPTPDPGSGRLLPDVLLPGLHRGVGILDLPFLSLALVLLTAHVRGTRTRDRAALTALTGLVAITVAVFGVLGNPMVGFDGAFVPAAGWYLTLLGGGLLLAAGAVRAPELVLVYLDLGI